MFKTRTCPTPYGRSMIEMLGVLALIGVLVIGGLMFYMFLINKWKANDTVHDVMLRATNVPILWENYANENFHIEEFLFPELPQNGTISTHRYAMHTYQSDHADYVYQVNVANVPNLVCRRIVELDPHTINGIRAGNETDADKFSRTNAGRTAHSVTDVCGTDKKVNVPVMRFYFDGQGFTEEEPTCDDPPCDNPTPDPCVDAEDPYCCNNPYTCICNESCCDSPNDPCCLNPTDHCCVHPTDPCCIDPTGYCCFHPDDHCCVNPTDPCCVNPTGFCCLNPTDHCCINPTDPCCIDPHSCACNPDCCEGGDPCVCNPDGCLCNPFSCTCNPDCCEGGDICACNPNDPCCTAPNGCECKPNGPTCTCEQRGGQVVPYYQGTCCEENAGTCCSVDEGCPPACEPDAEQCCEVRGGTMVEMRTGACCEPTECCSADEGCNPLALCTPTQSPDCPTPCAGGPHHTSKDTSGCPDIGSLTVVLHPTPVINSIATICCAACGNDPWPSAFDATTDESEPQCCYGEVYDPRYDIEYACCPWGSSVYSAEASYSFPGAPGLETCPPASGHEEYNLCCPPGTQGYTKTFYSWDGACEGYGSLTVSACCREPIKVCYNVGSEDRCPYIDEYTQAWWICGEGQCQSYGMYEC